MTKCILLRLFSLKSIINLKHRNELLNLNDYQKDLSEYINYGLNLMQNLETFFEQSDVHIKNKLLSSIFDEKIEFDGQKYRTPKFKEGFGFIYQKIKELQVLKKEKGDKLLNVSHLVHRIALFSKQNQSFIKSLENTNIC